MKDTTRVLQRFPVDATPQWVGAPGSRPPSTPPPPPPWADEHAPVAFDIDAEDTANLDAPLVLRLVARDPQLRDELARDARWSDALPAGTSEARSLCNLLAISPVSDAAHQGEPRIDVVDGEIAFTIDDRERLKATIASTMLFAPSDHDFALALHDARTLLADPALTPGAAKAATRGVWRTLPPAAGDIVELRKQIDRGLVARRAFRRVKAADGDFVCASFAMAASATPIAAVLSETMLDPVALTATLPCRALVAMSTHDGVVFRVLAIAQERF